MEFTTGKSRTQFLYRKTIMKLIKLFLFFLSFPIGSPATHYWILITLACVNSVSFVACQCGLKCHASAAALFLLSHESIFLFCSFSPCLCLDALLHCETVTQTSQSEHVIVSEMMQTAWRLQRGTSAIFTLGFFFFLCKIKAQYGACLSFDLDFAVK